MKANKLKDLTWLFFINIFISSFTFGGGYVVVSMVRKYFVEKRKIFNESDLITMSAISQTTPGAIAINLAALAGYKVAGTIELSLVALKRLFRQLLFWQLFHYGIKFLVQITSLWLS